MNGMFDRLSRQRPEPPASEWVANGASVFPILPGRTDPAPGTHTEDARPHAIRRTPPTLIDSHVTRLVAQTDAVPQKTRSGGTDEGLLHVSSLIGMCEREQAISRQHGKPSFTSVSGPMKIIWKIGRAVERHIRNSVLSARDWNDIYGVWTCACTASTHLGEYPRERTCPRCWKPLSHYREPALKNYEYGIVGSPDLTLIEMGYFLVVEVKSMNKDDFDKLEAPKADHVLQAMSYRRLYELAGIPVLDIVAVVYARKDFKFGGSRAVYKEYHVPAEPWTGQVGSMFEAARRVWIANQEGNLPDRVCDQVDCRRAKSCERASLCFSL